MSDISKFTKILQADAASDIWGVVTYPKYPEETINAIFRSYYKPKKFRITCNTHFCLPVLVTQAIDWLYNNM